MSSFLALDFETADAGADSACAIGLVWVEHNQIVQREHHLIRPPRQSFSLSYIHGISWEDVAAEASFGELWSTIIHKLESVDFVAAHNASFDRRVLYACCDAYSIVRPKQNFVCTMKLSREVWNLYPTKLLNVCEYLGIGLDHHQALSDAEACARIVIAANQHKARIKTMINCPSCQVRLRVPSGRDGQVICPRCACSFQAQT